MLVADLELLRAKRCWPSVSVITKPDHRSIAELRSVVAERLSVAAPDVAAGLLARLDESGAQMATSQAPSVVLYASPEFTHTVELPRAAQHRVVIDETFATRDLVVALARTHRYLVLELDSAQAWLWAGLGDLIRPVVPDGPLVESEGPPGVSRRLHLQERSKRQETRAERWLREVDAALISATGADDARPMFVIGNRRLGRRFVKLTHARPRPVSFVGGVVSHRGDLIRDLIEPELDTISATIQRRAIDEVAEATSNARFSEGFAAALAAAAEHRVDLLVVEEDFVVEPQTASVARTETHPGALDPLGDVVDELIEAVLDSGGRVQPVANGSLHAWGRVAAKLRH